MKKHGSNYGEFCDCKTNKYNGYDISYALVRYIIENFEKEELKNIIKNPKDIDVRFAFCFPDTYEIGMSHLGMKILYSLFNEREDI